MRPASRAAAAPALPVSINSDSPEGVTKSVALPPSTSMTYTSSVFRVCATATAHENIAIQTTTTKSFAARIAASCLSHEIFFGNVGRDRLPVDDLPGGLIG